jgi:hypothetical protein
MVGCACGAERETDPDRLVVRETHLGLARAEILDHPLVAGLSVPCHPMAVRQEDLHCLADENDANTVLRRHRSLMSAGDEDLGNRDLEQLSALRHRGDIPHFDAEGRTQGVEVEVRWRSKFVEVLEDGVTLDLQAVHHPIPPGNVISGDELASDVPCLLKINDATTNSIQAGLEDGALAFTFRHGELSPALGDSTEDGIIRLHRAKPGSYLAHDLLVGVA